MFDVDPLDLPSDPADAASAEIMAAPAVRLFRDRARAVDPRFDVTEDNAADVARICRSLDGVPLAIELAATRIRVLTPSAMLERLDHVLPLLVTGARDVPERQRTIRATVEWSVDLLGPDARALFVRLGVFSGDFSLAAVEAVAAAAPWAADALGRGPRARRRQPPATARRGRGAVLLDAGAGQGDRGRPVRAGSGCRVRAPRARRALRASRRRDRAAAPGNHPARGARPARGGAGQHPIGLPAPHRPRGLGRGRGRGVAPAAVLVDPEPASRGEGLDGGCPRRRRAARGLVPAPSRSRSRRGSPCCSPAPRSTLRRSRRAPRSSARTGMRSARGAR